MASNQNSKFLNAKLSSWLKRSEVEVEEELGEEVEEEPEVVEGVIDVDVGINVFGAAVDDAVAVVVVVDTDDELS